MAFKSNEEEQAAALYQLKEDYIKSVQKLNFDKIKQDVDMKDTVTLYHGTSTVYLNDILQRGILPRTETGISNWENAPTESIPNVTYLTNKWHYFYAVNATIMYLQKQFGEEWPDKGRERSIYPCYVECKVPKGLLVMDEDFIFTNYMTKKMKKSVKTNESLVYDPMECLAQYGTVGVIGAVPPEYIVSFTILAEPEMMLYVTDDKSQYQKDYVKWQSGKGKGVLKLPDLLKREEQSDYNGTWWLKDIPKNAIIDQIGINAKTNKIAIQMAPK